MMGEAVQLAAAARRVHYERRRPEDTVLYQLVQEHLETDLPDPTKGVPTHRGQDRRHHGSAANLNIHLHCLVLDGVYRTPAGVPVFHAGHAPTGGELQVLLTRIIKRLMNRMHRDVQLGGGTG
ncbi:MAG: hypothetical protein ACREXX_20275 [Gammaproteobacteria bacterium]